MSAETHGRAQSVLEQLQAGADFATLAKQISEDPGTREAGGDFGEAIDKTNRRDLSPQVIDALFKLQAGQTSAIVETPLGLEILKLNEIDGTRVRASHIFFAFKSFSTYTDPLKNKDKLLYFIHP